MQVLVIVGERWTCVMSILGTGCQLGYVIILEIIAVWGRFGSKLRSICISGFSVLFGDAWSISGFTTMLLMDLK